MLSKLVTAASASLAAEILAFAARGHAGLGLASVTHHDDKALYAQDSFVDPAQLSAPHLSAASHL